MHSEPETKSLYSQRKCVPQHFAGGDNSKTELRMIKGGGVKGTSTMPTAKLNYDKKHTTGQVVYGSTSVIAPNKPNEQLPIAVNYRASN